jgi:uncharacterized integral membrane protein (TIGR00698 family)
MKLRLVPGVLAALGVMVAGYWIADALGRALLASQGLSGGDSPISAVAMTIVIGLLLRNLLPLPAALAPGLKFCATTVLRLGIVLVGIRLSAFDVVHLGAAGLPVVLAAVGTGMLFVTWFNRLLGLPSRLGTLIAAGTSICGITAIVSTAPAIEADEREVAYAVANVLAFGVFGMVVYPYLAHAFLGRSETVGLFLGTAVHDTSQVVGAALTYQQLYADDVVLRVATVTKLTRNLFLAVVIPVLTWAHFRATATRRASRGDARWITFVPQFVLGFLVMALVRTTGDATLGSLGAAYGLWETVAWAELTSYVGDFWGSRVLLGTAMAAVGLNTGFSVFKGLGVKPFIVGFAGACVVGAVGLAMAVAFGRMVTL